MLNIEYDNKDYNSSETILIINCLLNAALMPVAILGNALVLIAIIRTPSIRSTSMLMLCSLAVSDLLVGIMVQPFYIAHHLTNETLLYLLEGIIGHSVCGVSLLTITAITVDRFIALHYHLRYATLVTKPRVKHTLALIWVFSFASLGFYFWNRRVYRVLLGVIIAICFIVSTFCYIRIYLTVRHHRSQIEVQQQAVQCQYATTNNTYMMRLKRSAVNTFLFYICMIACYFPAYVLLAIFGLGYMEWATEWNIATTMVFMNSSINPVLYCWRLRELRVAVAKTIKWVLRSQTYQD